MYSLFTVFFSFITSFIVYEPFYIMVSSGLLYGLVSLFKSLFGGRYDG